MAFTLNQQIMRAIGDDTHTSFVVDEICFAENVWFRADFLSFNSFPNYRKGADWRVTEWELKSSYQDFLNDFKKGKDAGVEKMKYIKEKRHNDYFAVPHKFVYIVKSDILIRVKNYLSDNGFLAAGIGLYSYICLDGRYEIYREVYPEFLHKEEIPSLKGFAFLKKMLTRHYFYKTGKEIRSSEDEKQETDR